MGDQRCRALVPAQRQGLGIKGSLQAVVGAVLGLPRRPAETAETEQCQQRGGEMAETEQCQNQLSEMDSLGLLPEQRPNRLLAMALMTQHRLSRH